MPCLAIQVIVSNSNDVCIMHNKMDIGEILEISNVINITGEGNIADSSNGKKKKGKPNEMGIILNITSEKTRYNKLLNRGISHNMYPDSRALEALGIKDNVMTLLGNIGWNDFV